MLKQQMIRGFCSKKILDLKQILSAKIPKERERIATLLKCYGDHKIGEVTVNMVYRGMRGIRGLICETSVLDPNEGIRFRGLSIPECQQKLPKASNGKQPLPEGLFWLLLTGEVPSIPQVEWLSKEWAMRASLPHHICEFLDNLPKYVHPMSQLAAACTILNTESLFVAGYHHGVPKTQLWECAYEDAMNLIGKLPLIVARIYKNTFKKGSNVNDIIPGLDWSMNFCKLLGYDNPEFFELMRMYLTIHSDHEGGNVSAHTVHLVSSALSDPYLAFAAGMNGLAGPLHGLANQEVLIWLEELRSELGEEPDQEQIKKFVMKTLKSGKVVPGYGHAVLRKTDPRFICQREFALQYFPNDPLFKIVSKVFEVVPPILQKLGKVQNPWPNVDAHSGVLFQYYGMKEMKFYTVLFGMSRALGVMASLIWDRALGFPIERPKSISTDLLIHEVCASEKDNNK